MKGGRAKLLTKDEARRIAANWSCCGSLDNGTIRPSDLRWGIPRKWLFLVCGRPLTETSRNAPAPSCSLKQDTSHSHNAAGLFHPRRRRAGVRSGSGHSRGKAPCPLCSQKRTFVDVSAMSAKCQKQTTHQHQKLGDIGRDPSRLIAVFATYPSPTRATSFGRHRKRMHLRSVATIGCLTARPTANRTVQLSYRSL